MNNLTNDRIDEILESYGIYCIEIGKRVLTNRPEEPLEEFDQSTARQAIQKLLIAARMDELEHANSNVRSQEYPFSVPRPPTWPMYADNRMNFLKDQLNTLEGK